MYCPNCGEYLRESNQRFCHNCGSKLTDNFEAFQITSERDQHTQTTLKPSSQVITDVPEIQQKPVVKGRVGTHSKKCLGFAITSLAIAAIGFYIAFYVYMFSKIGIFDPSMIMVRRIIWWTVIASIFLVGLSFGSSSRTHSKHAKNLEPVNAVEKVGSVLGIFGVIINAIAMGIFFILLLINISGFLL
ncbi:MAG: zinc-ribbon domain-containing protein [Candidatus Hodarchaeota archaeon]